jgi:hypothetical protein
MTVLGKILVFVILVLSLLWTFLTASAFAARTNWQAQAKRYQEEAQKAGQAATAMKTLLDAEREQSDDRARVLRADLERAEATAAQMRADRDTLYAAYQTLQATNQKVAAEQQPLIGRAERLQAEVGIKDDQIRQKDAQLNALTLSEQAAVVKANEQANVAKAQTDRANRLADQVQQLQEALATAASRGGLTRPGQPAEVRVPAPAAFRATVTGVQRVSDRELLVTINQGLDAGLQRNTELTLSRLTGQGQYLGRLLITQVNPKEAIGRFLPPSGKHLTSDDLPRAGDTATGSNQ